MSLTVVIPTQGRNTLQHCLESFRGQHGSFEILVVHDTHGQSKEEIANLNISQLCVANGARYIQFDAGYNDWGYPQMRYVYTAENIISTDYIMNIGDDDVMTPGSIQEMENIMKIGGWTAYMFQARLYPSPHRGNTHPVIIWNDSCREPLRQLVTGQNLVVPNSPPMMGNMIDDFVFIRDTLEKWKGRDIWVPVVTVDCY